MNTKLKYIGNWEELAKKTNWSAFTLAKYCNVSERTLRRHFLKQMTKNVRSWLTDHRQKKAMELLHMGLSVKEVAAKLGYKYTESFSREFKKFYGHCPIKINPSFSIKSRSVKGVQKVMKCPN